MDKIKRNLIKKVFFCGFLEEKNEFDVRKYVFYEVWGYDFWDVSIGIVLVNVLLMFVILEIYGIVVFCRSYINVVKLMR